MWVFIECLKLCSWSWSWVTWNWPYISPVLMDRITAEKKSGVHSSIRESGADINADCDLIGEASKKQSRHMAWSSIRSGQEDNASPPGPQTWAITVFIISLQNVLEIKEIALLLVPDVLRLALGKILHAHPPASSPSHPLSLIKYSNHMGIALIAWVSLDHSSAAPQSTLALCGRLS